MTRYRFLVGDVRETLSTLPDDSAQCVVTSPPYWGLRDYGHEGQLGLEPTPDAYVANMVQVFRDVRRVLKDDGTLWLNLGDSYANDGKWGGETGGKQAYLDDASRKRVGREKRVTGLKPKDMVGIPWMVAFALRSDGWYLRSDIIWAKPNPMPESMTDRPTKAREYVFLLTKSPGYYYDAAAIAEQAVGPAGGNVAPVKGSDQEKMRTRTGLHAAQARAREAGGYTSRNKRTVWTVTTQPYSGAHFATFPEALIEPCILAGSREGDTVLDPFNGSGTTGAVSVRHRRHYIGCELNPEYIALARERIGAVAPLFASEVA